MDKVFKQAMADDDTLNRVSLTHQTRFAAVSLAFFHMLASAGEEGYKHDQFWHLSDKSGKERFLPELRKDFIGRIAAHFNLIMPDQVDKDGAKLDADTIRNNENAFKARMTSIGRGIDYAVDLCCAGGTDMVHLSPGKVLSGFNEKLATFSVTPASLVLRGEDAHGHLATAMGTDDKAKRALVKLRPNTFSLVDGDVMIALDNRLYSVAKEGKTQTTIKADNTRVRLVANSKRYETIKYLTVDDKTGKEKVVREVVEIAKAKQRRASLMKTAALIAANRGRPQGTSNNDTPGGDQPGLKQTLQTALRSLDAIMAEPSAKPDPKNMTDSYWSTNPDRSLIDGLIIKLSLFRSNAEKLERDHKAALEAEKQKRSA
jgi:hypothetical protein